MSQSEEDTLWMSAALDEARLALAEGEIPVGAVLVKDGQLIAKGHNRRENDKDCTAHGEMTAMRQGCRVLRNWRLKGCTLYVTLEPCPMCTGAMVMSRLSRCVYGAKDLHQGCCGSVYDFSADPAFQTEMTWKSGVMENECTQLMNDFFDSKRKR